MDDGVFSKEKILIHMHFSETEDEIRFSKEKYGVSPVEFLDSIGIRTKRFIGCHGCYLDENDCRLLKSCGAKKLVHSSSQTSNWLLDEFFLMRWRKNIHTILFWY